MEEYKGTYFPHEERERIVKEDGRPFWREYYPNFYTGPDSRAFFIESLDEIEKYLSARQGQPIYIYLEHDRAYDPECFVMSWYTSLNDKGEVIPYGHDEKGRLNHSCSCHCVMGFGQNLPDGWFKKYNKERCMKLEEEKTKQEYQKRKENNEQK